ncbi:alpha/beta hydrolase [Niabella drilacis]|uniref:Acetyl esterase/lipase n=1 Tax=Niabella drilacis (strain DSM 25811 / CCM 8410 / CCUG 62505 / LMG 26954 / E90) TaxID=1285928 RepID=A0A1G6Z4Q4_NIADE|nr:alpha/beta hydrolase [Niabella drilacis]SDD96776.1 Acetyl esterase/lipase [Niabella drilacis]
MKRILLYTLCLSIFITACNKEDDFKPDNSPIPPPSQAYNKSNVSYGPDALQAMDIYLPAGRSAATTKVFIFIHGGAWAEGDKADADHAPLIDSLRRRLPDWAIFNLNYRLAGGIPLKNKFPAQEEDIKKAIQYIYDKRQTFTISDKWVFAGASAGAHLALLQGYKNNSPIKPKAIIDLFGPNDMTALYNSYNNNDPAEAVLISLLMSGTPSNNPTMYHDSSPINYVTAQSAPTIIFHGGLDDVVPKEQSYTLQAKLNSVSVQNQLVYYENQTHGWSDPAIWYDCLNKAQSFITANVP